MLLRWRVLLFFMWITDAEKPPSSNGHRKLDLQFDDVTFMDSVSRAAMRRMHDDLDTDEDGNVSLTEGKVSLQYLKSQTEMMESSEKDANLAGFATDVDGRITEQEFWDSWIHSDVHNWTNAEILIWLKYEVELPQYSSIFHALNISGAAFPILACNGSVASVLVDGSKENKLKLMLRAKEIVLFGPPKAKANFLKDALLTLSLVLALSGMYYGVHVQRNASRTIENIQEKMKALQKGMETIAEAENEMENIWKNDISGQDDDRSRESNSGESEDSVSIVDDVGSTKLSAVMKELDATKEALRNAEKQIEVKAFELPAGLVDHLQTTYQVESKLFEMKKKKVYKDVEQTKVQFQKIERNRSTFFGILQVVHSRQMDSFDFHIQQTRDEFRELQAIMKERRKRWEKIEQLCKFRIKQSGSRGSSALPRVKLTPEEEFISSLESAGSVASLATGNAAVDRRSHSFAQRPKARRKRPSLTNASDDESRDTVSLHSFKQRKSPVPAKKFGTLPANTSAPSFSTAANGHDKTKTPTSDAKVLPHSESADPLLATVPIPETVNRSFPKRSPRNKRRAKIPDSLTINGGSAPVSPASLRAVTPARLETDSSANLTQPDTLTVEKRSTSVQCLPSAQKNFTHELAVAPQPLAEKKYLLELAEKSAKVPNGAPKSTPQATSNRTSPTPEEKERKSNLLKRVFRVRKTKKEK